MKRLKKYHILPALALLLLGAVLGVQVDSYVSDDKLFSGVKKLRNAFVIINRQYVEPVDAKKVAETGIRGMLDELDPHSSYIPAEQVKDVRESYQGSFGGIGIVFETVEDTARVISPIADGPSEKVGVMAGDRIVEIEDSTAVGLSDQEIQDRLKGPVGTEVQMTVLRPITDTRQTFTITRDEIPYYSVNSSYMVDDRTGYIKIDRFAMTTHDEFMKKAKTLKDQGMERLVLDLSSNPGGVMQSSIEIADEMLGDGMEIVQTKGRDKSMNRTWRASGGGALEDMPIIVLVSQRSASASEILAGALQDHDRALLVGQRTFGKALVQKQFELEDGSLLQMTTGRYYTPAGRLIQTPYEDGNRQNYYQEKFSDYDKALFNPSEYKESIADSLRYQTDHGRVVFGGGGIMPDYVVAPDTSALEQLIRSPAISNQVALKWLTAHEDRLRSEWGDREQAYIDNFSVEPAMVDSFWTYAQRNGVTLTDSPDEVDRSEGVFPRSAVAASREDLEVYLKGALASHLYGTRAAQPILNRVNPAFREALSLWDRAQQLASYHTASASPVNKN